MNVEAVSVAVVESAVGGATAYAERGCPATSFSARSTYCRMDAA